MVVGLSDASGADAARMTGGLMPKIFAMRWPIGIVAALLLIAGVSLSWGGSHASRVTSPLSAISAFFAGDEYGGERRELRSLHAALQRIEVDLHQQPNARALASLRTEQEAVVQRVREVASRVPADILVPEIRRWLEPATDSVGSPGIATGIAAVTAPGAAVRRVEETAPARPAGELRAGLRPPNPVAALDGLALDQRPPWPLFSGRKAPQRTAPATSAPASADRTETRQSSR
jgi:hypothetical protein